MRNELKVYEHIIFVNMVFLRMCICNFSLPRFCFRAGFGFLLQQFLTIACFLNFVCLDPCILNKVLIFGPYLDLYQSFCWLPC